MRQRTLILLLLLASAACAREEAISETIEPATPARTSPAPLVDEIGKEPMITTTGSVPPGSAAQGQFHDIRITDDGIAARSSVPRVHTVLRLRNETRRAHAIEIRADGKTLAGPEKIEPGAQAMVQVRLVRDRYEIVCTTHPNEAKGVIETFQPQ